MIKPTLTLLAAFAGIVAIGYYTADTHTPPRDNPAVLKPVIETTHEERMRICINSKRSEQDCSLFVERSYTGEGYQHLREAK
jgi:hypothetical protein